MDMKIAIPKETLSGEQRVALVPTLVAELTKLPAEILLQNSAGEAAGFSDATYTGVNLIAQTEKLFTDATIICKVQMPSAAEIALLKPHSILIGLLSPSRSIEQITLLQKQNITSFALELVPRISRAQSLDALTSQASVAGYKSVLLAANQTQRFFPMISSAAGTIRPLQVLIIGAGVAGLQAIATAKRLGAIVYAYDVRAAAREQVESLGAKMISSSVSAETQGGYARTLSQAEQQAQQNMLAEHLAKSDVVITTAGVPGKKAPLIITRAMLEKMRPGSLIVDIMAENGGNCELTQANQIVVHQGVQIMGPVNLPSMMAHDASILYARNMVNFIKLLHSNTAPLEALTDPILSACLLTHQGKIYNQT